MINTEAAGRIKDSLWAIAKHEVERCNGNRDALRSVYETLWVSRNHGFCCDHLVTEDVNTDDCSVLWCISTAEEERHYDCLLMLMFLMAIGDEDLRDKVVLNYPSAEVQE